MESIRFVSVGPSTDPVAESDIDALEARAANIESDVTSAQSNIISNTSDIATNAANISTNTSDIATNAANISSNTNNISTNTSDIATNAGNISSNSTSITAANSAIVALQDCMGTSASNLGNFNPPTNFVTNNSNVRNAIITLDAEAKANKDNILLRKIVTANPPTTTDTLSSVTIGTTNYSLGGGTTVVANPLTAATDDLTKLTVGSTTYDVPGTVRNYEYSVITATNTYTTTGHSTSINPTWTDVNDITITITPTRNDSPIRLQAHFFGEVSTHDGDLKFRFKRVQGGATTYVKHSNDLQGTLTVVGHDSSGASTTQQPWQIIAFDSNASLGTIVYTLQIADHGGGTFYLNRTVSTTSSADRELLNSTIEAEEVMTGPPLTVNNVAVSGTPSTYDVLQYDGSAWTNTPNIIPVGSITIFAGGTAPFGYILCDGSVISRTTYAALFAVIGTTYGSGDGSTTFKVPDLRARFVTGQTGGASIDIGGSYNYALGATGGVNRHTLSISEMPSHDHFARWPRLAQYQDNSGFISVEVGDRSDGNYNYNQNNLADITHTGGSQSHENRPPFIAMNYIIKI